MESSNPKLSDAERQTHALVLWLYLSAAIMIIAGVALGIALNPAWFGIAGLGLFDIVLAAFFASGRIGPLAARQKAEADGDAAQIAESDPEYNPYARDD